MNRSEQDSGERVFQIISEIGHGAQGSVYLVRDAINKQVYAAKVVKITISFILIQYEKQDRFNLEEYILYCVRDQEGFPQIIDTTIIEGHQVILMNILGDNIRNVKDKQPDKKLSLGTSLSVFYQMVARLECLHMAGFVHCDIKPDNILISADPYQDDKIYLVDYGLAHQYLNENHQHVKPPKQINFKGSISYCSLNLLRKKYPSRRDDLESLIYVILHLYAGSLPWHSEVNKLVGRERIDHVIEMKRKLSIHEYAPHVPESLIKCYEHVRGLQYSDQPDYDYIKSAILEELRKNKLSLNKNFEWSHDYCLKSSYASCFENEDDIKHQGIKKQSIVKKIKQEQVENESNSMEVDYYDIMSLEIDEGTSEISLQKIETRQNILSSLTPDSMNLSPQEPAVDGNKNYINSIKMQLGACPFDFAEDDDFDYKAMQRDIQAYRNIMDQQQTVRKISSLGPMSKAIEAIQKERRYSMQTEPYMQR